MKPGTAGQIGGHRKVAPTFPFPTPSPVPTIRLLVEYDGTDFQGWQRQRTGQSVQATLENALAVILGVPVGVVGAGRTDTGVHARGQVAQFETDRDVDPRRLLASLGGLLPHSVAVRCAETAPAGFHSRFDATSRTYHYHVATSARALDAHTRVVLRTPTDFGAMDRAAQALVGQHECSAFCRTRSETTNRTCAVQSARWLPEGRSGDWRFEITADRFVHGMVRAVVGTLLEVGRGRRPETALADALATHDRCAAGPAAPPRGLVLHHVGYPDPPFSGCD